MASKPALSPESRTVIAIIGKSFINIFRPDKNASRSAGVSPAVFNAHALQDCGEWLQGHESLVKNPAYVSDGPFAEAGGAETSRAIAGACLRRRNRSCNRSM